MNRDPFFIGWSWRSARPLIGFAVPLIIVLMAGSAGLGLVLGSNVDDPGSGDFAGDRTVTGVLLAKPYAMLVTDPDAAHPAGHAMLLAGGGKVGVQEDAAKLDGQRVRIQGSAMKRGTVDMQLVWRLQAVEGVAVP